MLNVILKPVPDLLKMCCLSSEGFMYVTFPLVLSYYFQVVFEISRRYVLTRYFMQKISENVKNSLLTLTVSSQYQTQGSKQLRLTYSLKVFLMIIISASVTN